MEATVEAMQSGEAAAWVSSSNEEAAATASSTGPRIAMGQRGQNIHMLYMQIYPYIKEELHIYYIDKADAFRRCQRRLDALGSGGTLTPKRRIKAMGFSVSIMMDVQVNFFICCTMHIFVKVMSMPFSFA